MAAISLSGCAKDPESITRFKQEIPWANRGVWLKADTHIHTTFSDGAHSIAEVAGRAKENGCDVIAITDHADRNLEAASHAYHEAIEDARRQFPGLIIIEGMEWNVPPWGGDEHATILMPPGPRAGQVLAEFKARFDDLGREQHDPSLADEGLEWLAREGAGDDVKPVMFYDHPSRKRERTYQILSDLRRWRAVNDLVVGFSGAPGHQGMQPVGSYKKNLTTIDRWDPAAAEVGGVWDQLLAAGLDVWAAHAPSDFHDAEGLKDYWPGQFSETWVYAPERSAQGVLQALRAGSFFGVHGHIAREVQLEVQASGLDRPAMAGEAIQVPPGTRLQVSLKCDIPPRDWTGAAHRIDSVELIAITKDGARVLSQRPPTSSNDALVEETEAVDGEMLLRARGRRVIDGEPDYMFYTNPIRISASATSTIAAPRSPALSVLAVGRLPTWLKSPVTWIACIGALLVAAMLRLLVRRRRHAQGHGKTVGFAPPRRVHYAFASAVFAAFAIYGSLVPLDFHSVAWSEAVGAFSHEMAREVTVESRIDWGQNVLLFLPLGYFLFGALVVDSRSWLRRVVAAVTCLLCGLLLSLAIEFAQVFFPPRVCSISDIAAQQIGLVAGMGLWLMVGTQVNNRLREMLSARCSSTRLDLLLRLYCLGLLIYSLAPLDLSLMPHELWQKYTRGQIQLLPLSNAPLSSVSFEVFANLLLFVPVGATIARRGPHRLRPMPACLFYGALAALSIELAQIVVASRVTALIDVVSGSIGSGFGALLVHWRGIKTQQVAPPLSGENSKHWIWLGAMILHMAFLVLFFWWPYELVNDEQLVRERWFRFFAVPMTALYWGDPLNLVTQVFRKSLLFGLLGMLAVNWIKCFRLPSVQERCGIAAILIVGAALGMLIEVGQLWLSQSTPDISDVLLYAFGMTLGAILTRFVTGDAQTSAILDDAQLEVMLTRSSWPLRLSLMALAAIGAVLAGVFWSAEAHHSPRPVANPRNLVARQIQAFVAVPNQPYVTPRLQNISLPDFRGGYAVWGGTGRDARGHIWIGVSAQGVPIPSAHLLEFDPANGSIHDRGDVVSQLKQNFVYRRGEGQMKIHSKIVQAADGCLYFASMDEQGESESGGRLPDWGSHLWRLNPKDYSWEHLLAAPEGLIAIATAEHYVYALGYFDHVLYQYDCTTGKSRSLHAGSVGGHISRNFFCDQRGHIYVPRLRWSQATSTAQAALVEFNSALEQVAESPLEHYLSNDDLLSHGIVGFQHLADGSIAFVTHVGRLYRVHPKDSASARVEDLDWFHPRGESYTASMFTYGGERYLLGVSQGQPFEWLVYDLMTKQSTVTPLPETQTLKDLLLYGSETTDDAGNFYVVGTYRPGTQDASRPAGENAARPIAFRVCPPN